METQMISRYAMPAYRTVLSNGLTVVTIPDQSGLVGAELYIGAGSWLDPIPGVAHLLEHVVASGENQMLHERFTRLLEESADLCAFTGWEGIQYRCQNAFAADLEEILNNLFEIVFREPISSRKFEQQQRIVLEEMRKRNTPKNARKEEVNRMFEQVDERRLAGPNGGSVESIPLITPHLLEEFRCAWYTCANSVLIVFGTAEHEQVVQWAQMLSEDIPTGTRAPIPKYTELKAGHHIIRHADYNPMLRVVIKAPDMMGKQVLWQKALLNCLRANDGLLMRELRTLRGLVYGVTTNSPDPPFYYCNILVPCAEENIKVVEQVVRESLHRARENPEVFSRTLESWRCGYAKHLLLEKIIANAASQLGDARASWYENLWQNDHTEEWVREITIADIAAQLDLWLNPDQIVWVHMLRA